MAYLYNTAKTETTISVNVSGCDTSYAKSDRTCKWYLDGIYKGSTSLGAKVSSGGEYTFRNLEAGETYHITCNINAPDWAQSTTLQVWITTKEAPKPSISSFSVSAIANSLKANCSWSVNNGKSRTTYEIRASDSNPGNYQTSGYSKGNYSYGTTSAQISFNGSKLYYVWLNLFFNGSYVASSLKTVRTSLNKPTVWTWYSSEQSAFNNNGPVTALTRTRWNNFIGAVNEAIAYYNEANNRSLSRIYSSMGTDRIMYATTFTEVCTKLNSLCSALGVTNCGITRVNPGNNIMGYYFTNLSAALNRCINNMN